MEARTARCAIIIAAIVSMGAGYRTRNFVVTAPTKEIAKTVGDEAERFRRELAIEWVGHELRPWYAPCPVRVKVGQIGAGGMTSFSFDRGHVFGWKMTVQGPLDRILDSVLPHEVTHTILASHFRHPLPRWADEGAATLSEHQSERRRQALLVQQLFEQGRRIPLRKLLNLTEYPAEMREVLSLYAEGYTLAELLVQKRGKRRYLMFLADAKQRGWTSAIREHYDYESIDELEGVWKEWILAGSPPVNADTTTRIASVESRSSSGSQNVLVVRSQNPDDGQTDGRSRNKRKSLKAPRPRISTASRLKRTAKSEILNDGWVVSRRRSRTNRRQQPADSADNKLADKLNQMRRRRPKSRRAGKASDTMAKQWPSEERLAKNETKSRIPAAERNWLQFPVRSSGSLSAPSRKVTR